MLPREIHANLTRLAPGVQAAKSFNGLTDTPRSLTMFSAPDAPNVPPACFTVPIAHFAQLSTGQVVPACQHVALVREDVDPVPTGQIEGRARR